ncbi:MAG: PPC domain-containing protein [Planctomycetaceae bacterium]|nr:PPC domain-containing protein [Planctomycetaceae bacterium]
MLKTCLPTLFLILVVSPARAAAPDVSGTEPTGIQTGQSADLALQGKPELPLSVVTDYPGLAVSVSEDGKSLHVDAAQAAAGVAFLRFHNPEGASDLIPLHIGLLPEVAEVEPNNHWRDAPNVATQTTINGVLHAGGEVDTFGCELEQGQTLVSAVDANTALASPMDAVLQILSPEGFVLEQVDDAYGNDPQLSFIVPTTGRYFVRLFAFPSAPNSTINFAGGKVYQYRLTLTNGPFIDHLFEGAEGQLNPHGWNLGEGLDVANTPGRHHYRRLLNLAQPADVITQSGEAPVPLTLKTRLQGNVAPRESVRFQITGTKSTALRIRVRAQALYSELDPLVQILDAEGKLLKEFDDVGRDNRDVDASWTPPADANYTLVLQDRFGHGGERYFFETLVEEDQPRADLTVTANHFEATVDKPLEIEVQIARAGLQSPLEITATGLPEGAKVTPVTSEPKGDSSKKVTLKIEHDGNAPFSGSIQILATIPDAPSEPIVATAPTKLTGVPTNSIWLTLPAKAKENIEEK